MWRGITEENEDWTFCKYCNFEFGNYKYYYQHTRGLTHIVNVQNWEPNIWNLDPATVQPLPLNKRYPPILEPQPKPYGPELPKNFVFKENVLVTGSPSKEIDIPTDEAKSPANSESENSCQPQPKPYVPELPKLDENKTAVAENVSEVINDVVVKDCSKTDSQEHEAEKAVPVVEGTSILIIETSEGDFSKISEVKVLPEEKQPESIKIPGETPVLKNISRGRKVQMDAMSQMSGEPRPPGVDDDEEEEEPRPPGVEDEVADDDCVIVRESRVYRCELCQITTTSENNLEAHLKGLPHLKKAEMANLPAETDPTDIDAIRKVLKERGLVGMSEDELREASKSIQERKLHIMEILKKQTEPYLGLDYLVEYQCFGPGGTDLYSCKLCETTISEDQIVAHVTGMRHNKRYILYTDVEGRQVLLKTMASLGNVNKEVQDRTKLLFEELPEYQPQLRIEVPHLLRLHYLRFGKKGLLQREGKCWEPVEPSKDIPIRVILNGRQMEDIDKEIKKMFAEGEQVPSSNRSSTKERSRSRSKERERSSSQLRSYDLDNFRSSSPSRSYDRHRNRSRSPERSKRRGQSPEKSRRRSRSRSQDRYRSRIRSPESSRHRNSMRDDRRSSRERSPHRDGHHYRGTYRERERERERASRQSPSSERTNRRSPRKSPSRDKERDREKERSRSRQMSPKRSQHLQSHNRDLDIDRERSSRRSRSKEKGEPSPKRKRTRSPSGSSSSSSSSSGTDSSDSGKAKESWEKAMKSMKDKEEEKKRKKRKEEEEKIRQELIEKRKKIAEEERARREEEKRQEEDRRRKEELIRRSRDPLLRCDPYLRDPYRERDRDPYRERDRDPYRERDRDPYRERDRDPYRERDQDPYRDRERDPYLPTPAWDPYRAREYDTYSDPYSSRDKLNPRERIPHGSREPYGARDPYDQLPPRERDGARDPYDKLPPREPDGRIRDRVPDRLPNAPMDDEIPVRSDLRRLEPSDRNRLGTDPLHHDPIRNQGHRDPYGSDRSVRERDPNVSESDPMEKVRHQGSIERDRFQKEEDQYRSIPRGILKGQPTPDPLKLGKPDDHIGPIKKGNMSQEMRSEDGGYGPNDEDRRSSDRFYGRKPDRFPPKSNPDNPLGPEGIRPESDRFESPMVNRPGSGQNQLIRSGPGSLEQSKPVPTDPDDYGPRSNQFDPIYPKSFAGRRDMGRPPQHEMMGSADASHSRGFERPGKGQERPGHERQDQGLDRLERIPDRMGHAPERLRPGLDRFGSDREITNEKRFGSGPVMFPMQDRPGPAGQEHFAARPDRFSQQLPEKNAEGPDRFTPQDRERFRPADYDKSGPGPRPNLTGQSRIDAPNPDGRVSIPDRYGPSGQTRQVPQGEDRLGPQGHSRGPNPDMFGKLDPKRVGPHGQENPGPGPRSERFGPEGPDYRGPRGPEEFPYRANQERFGPSDRGGPGSNPNRLVPFDPDRRDPAGQERQSSGERRFGPAGSDKFAQPGTDESRTQGPGRYDPQSFYKPDLGSERHATLDRGRRIPGSDPYLPPNRPNSGPSDPDGRRGPGSESFGPPGGRYGSQRPDRMQQDMLDPVRRGPNDFDRMAPLRPDHRGIPEHEMQNHGRERHDSAGPYQHKDIPKTGRGPSPQGAPDSKQQKVDDAFNAIEKYLEEYKEHQDQSQPSEPDHATMSPKPVERQLPKEVPKEAPKDFRTEMELLKDTESKILSSLTKAIKEKTGQDVSSAEMLAKALTNALAKTKTSDGNSKIFQERMVNLAERAQSIELGGFKKQDKPLMEPASKGLEGRPPWSAQNRNPRPGPSASPLSQASPRPDSARDQRPPMEKLDRMRDSPRNMPEKVGDRPFDRMRGGSLERMRDGPVEGSSERDVDMVGRSNKRPFDDSNERDRDRYGDGKDLDAIRGAPWTQSSMRQAHSSRGRPQEQDMHLPPRDGNGGNMIHDRFTGSPNIRGPPPEGMRDGALRQPRSRDEFAQGNPRDGPPNLYGRDERPGMLRDGEKDRFMREREDPSPRPQGLSRMRAEEDYRRSSPSDMRPYGYMGPRDTDPNSRRDNFPRDRSPYDTPTSSQGRGPSDGYRMDDNPDNYRARYAQARGPDSRSPDQMQQHYGKGRSSERDVLPPTEDEETDPLKNPRLKADFDTLASKAPISTNELKSIIGNLFGQNTSQNQPPGSNVAPTSSEVTPGLAALGAYGDSPGQGNGSSPPEMEGHYQQGSTSGPVSNIRPPTQAVPPIQRQGETDIAPPPPAPIVISPMEPPPPPPPCSSVNPPLPPPTQAPATSAPPTSSSLTPEQQQAISYYNQMGYQGMDMNQYQQMYQQMYATQYQQMYAAQYQQMYAMWQMQQAGTGATKAAGDKPPLPPGPPPP